MSLIEVPLWCLQGRNNLFCGRVKVCRKHDPYLSGIEYVPYIATLLVEPCALGYLATLCGLEVGFGRPRDIKLQTRLFTGLLRIGPCYLCPATSSRLPTIIQVRTLPPRHIISGEHQRSLGGGQSLFDNDTVVPRTYLYYSLYVYYSSAGSRSITLDDVETVKDGLPVNEGFTSLGEAHIYDVFCFYNSEFSGPDARVVRFVARSFDRFFAFYVLLACFIFLNLILAVVYNESFAVSMDSTRWRGPPRHRAGAVTNKRHAGTLGLHKK